LEEIYRRRGFSDSLYGKEIRIEVFKKVSLHITKVKREHGAYYHKKRWRVQ
jgi:hypothetical protein